MTLTVTLFRLLLSCEYLPVREQKLSILDKNVSVKLHQELFWSCDSDLSNKLFLSIICISRGKKKKKSDS